MCLELARKKQLHVGAKHWGIESCAIYWHYVDVVWIFFYPALYLIGTAHH
jgi:heme/copper-type cytochrome/quinol oxidase subunit 3